MNMYKNEDFDTWLKNAAGEVMKNISSGAGASSQEMMYLLLHAQTNHITHLNETIHKDITQSRDEANRRSEEVQRAIDQHREETNRRFEEVQRAIDQHREETNRRFEDVNKRFEDVNKRFEDVNKGIKLIQWMCGVGFTILGSSMVALVIFLLTQA